MQNNTVYTIDIYTSIIYYIIILDDFQKLFSIHQSLKTYHNFACSVLMMENILLPII